MQDTHIAIPQKLYEKLNSEARRHRLEVADIIEILLEGAPKKALGQMDTRLLHDLLALAPRFRGPTDLSSTYERVLYGGAS